VALTDAPACGFDQLNVSLSKVRVHQSASAGPADPGWIEIRIDPLRKINLLNLRNGVLEELGQTVIPAGTYAQIWLVLDPYFYATEVQAGSSFENPLGVLHEPILCGTTVCGYGVKVNHTFTVEAHRQTDLVLDFDACRSVVLRPRLKAIFGVRDLRPVIRVLPRTQTAIAGTVDVALADVVVSAQKDGAIVRATVPNATGEFVLSPIDPMQSPYDVVITAKDRVTAVVAAVPVLAEATTRISTMAAPISPTVSVPTTTHTVSGKVQPDNVWSDVRAVQTVGAIAVEIAHTNAIALGAGSLTDAGNYTLILPTGAPELSVYAGPLPLTFAPVPASAGQYTLEAAATGYMTRSGDLVVEESTSEYATQTVTVDVSTMDKTQDFVLVVVP